MFLEPCRRRLTVPRLLHRKRDGLTNDRTRRAGADRCRRSRSDLRTQPPQSELSQLSLEQLADLPIDSVFSASMYMQKVTEAPSSVTIITAERDSGIWSPHAR